MKGQNIFGTEYSFFNLLLDFIRSNTFGTIKILIGTNN